jgi:tripartite-type tricarboxylate transporter receptor subunit TctC
MRTAICRRTMITAALAAGSLAAPPLVSRGWTQRLRPEDRAARIVVPLAAGGTSDLVGRVVADILAKATGQAFTIENRTGGDGNVGAELVARAAPDGRTLLLGHVGTAVTNQYLFKYLPYDSDSFAPVALVGEVANVLVVHPGFHCHSFPEFITWCQTQRPFKESYASPAIGSVGHLAMESLQARLGIKLSHMAYRRRSLMFRELLEGHVQMAMDNLPGCLPSIRSGALRALAVSSAGRWFAAPDIPAVSEHGFGDYKATLWWYVAAPAGTPIALVQSLSDAIVDGLAAPSMADRMRGIGVMATPRCAADLAAHIAAENTRWRKVIAAAGIEPR